MLNPLSLLSIYWLSIININPERKENPKINSEYRKPHIFLFTSLEITLSKQYKEESVTQTRRQKYSPRVYLYQERELHMNDLYPYVKIEKIHNFTSERVLDSHISLSVLSKGPLYNDAT